VTTPSDQHFREANSILIAYVTAGTGHRRAAEAIAEAAKAQLPQARVECVDLLADVPAGLRWAYPRVYDWLVRHVPSLWAILYDLLDRRGIFEICQPLRRCWNRLMARRFVRRLREAKPDVVVATHFFPADVAAAAKGAAGLPFRLLVVITDLFPHRLWLAPEADGVVVGSPDTQSLCRQRGVPDERLLTSGIPIGSRFHPADDRPALSRSLGLDPSRRTVLIASGGMGVGPINQLATGLIAREAVRPHGLQLLVVCGHNRPLADRLNILSASSPMPVRVYGFVETMPELMQVSDALITKAGGLTVMEALAVGLPMILCGTIPGQEQFNAEYVVQRGAGVMVPTAREAIAAVLRLLDDPTQLQAMRASALALGRPGSARDLVERLIGFPMP
jgi:processive 1,2-diacylglycerol beta-glucosyltransferase